MSQPNASSQSRRKLSKALTDSSGSSSHKLVKKISSSASYSVRSAKETSGKNKTDSLQCSKVVNDIDSSKLHIAKSLDKDANSCFSGRRLWTKNAKHSEYFATNYPLSDGAIEEECEFVGVPAKQLRTNEYQMQKVQRMLSNAEERLRSKDQEINRLKRKVRDWEARCKNQEILRKKEQQERKNQIDNSEYLYKRCLMLEHRIYEMERFLADYGLIWVGDTNDSLRMEVMNNNYIETCYDQLTANIDQLNLVAGKDEVYVHRNEKGSGASFKTQACVSLKFYKNGMIVQEGTLRPYSDPRTDSFLRDILDGYFPSELQQDHPNGVPFKVEDHRTEMYIGNYQNFPGPGYRLGRQSLGDNHALSVGIQKLNNVSHVPHSGSFRQKENFCSNYITCPPLPLTARSLKSKSSSESQSIDIETLRSQILASHNNICSDTHLQSHINAELRLSSRKEKRDLATRNTECDLSMHGRTSKSNGLLKFSNGDRSLYTEVRNQLTSPRPRSRSACTSGHRFNVTSASKAKLLSESGSVRTVKTLDSATSSGLLKNPRTTKSVTHTKRFAPPILHQINEPTGKPGELRLKVRSLNGGTVYLVHVSADETVAKLYQLLNSAFAKTWRRGYKIILSGYSPRRLDRMEMSLRESGLTRDSVLHLVND